MFSPSKFRAAQITSCFLKCYWQSRTQLDVYLQNKSSPWIKVSIKFAFQWPEVAKLISSAVCCTFGSICISISVTLTFSWRCCQQNFPKQAAVVLFEPQHMKMQKSLPCFTFALLLHLLVTLDDIYELKQQLREDHQMCLNSNGVDHFTDMTNICNNLVIY